MAETWIDSWRRGACLLADPEQLVRSSDVGGEAAWQDLRRVGAIREIFPGVGVEHREPITPRIRAAALGPQVPARTIIAGVAAAWIWGAAPQPVIVDLIHPRGVHRPAHRPGRRARQAMILRSEVEELDGIPVTGPLRTAVDVATHAEPDQARMILLGLARRCGLDLAAAARSLELRYRWPGRDHARMVLASAQ